ncbi:cell cycle negative regulator roughex [Drosophila montana]|uniref:cell cycle negative regulator roughex n=1 Tax=Drosophila montana TaxID=40370 RepID=UPI00313F2769
MHEEQTTDAPAIIASPSQVMRHFVQCMDDDDVRRELTDDCILSVLGRSIKGVAAVTGYVRTQLTARYRHVGFQAASHCSEARKSLLTDRYARSFQVLRSRPKASKPMPASLHMRPESDDDEPDAGDCLNQLVTPPRSSAPAQNSQLLQYIESPGVLEADHEHDDGGIDLGESCQVTLTLGYRVYNSECAVEICLVIYEKLKPRSLAHPARNRTSRSSRNVHTDDEGELPATRSVRRTLFTSAADSEDPEESMVRTLPDVSPAKAPPALTPRKRQHKTDPNVKSKRLTVLGGMRF